MPAYQIVTRIANARVYQVRAKNAPSPLNCSLVMVDETEGALAVPTPALILDHKEVELFGA